MWKWMFLPLRLAVDLHNYTCVRLRLAWLNLDQIHSQVLKPVSNAMMMMMMISYLGTTDILRASGRGSGRAACFLDCPS